jgi:hypothetical protein
MGQIRRDGYIDARRLYTAEGVNRATGLSRLQLDEGRQVGVLKPKKLGNRYWYRGSELIAWIMKCGKTVKQKELQAVECDFGDA